MTSANSSGGLWVDCHAQVELSSRPTINEILDKVRRICLKPKIQKITIEMGKPILVHWIGPPNDDLDLSPEEETTPSKVFRHINLDPFDHDWEPAKLLGQAVMTIEAKGLFVSHVIIGESTLLMEWLGLDFRDANFRAPEVLMGGRILTDQSVPEDVILMIGSPDSICTLDHAQYGVKMTMELTNER